MEFFSQLFDLTSEISHSSSNMLHAHPILAYLMFSLTIFLETGFIVFCFLPGDLFLFLLGGLSAKGDLNPFIITFLLSAACILGSFFNYLIGRYGLSLLNRYFGKAVLSPESLQTAQVQYQKYGGIALIISRFFPVLRSCMPLISGLSQTPLANFMFYNVIGAFTWIGGMVGLGYLLSEFSFVKKYESLIHFGAFSVMILTVSLTLLKYAFSVMKRILFEKS